MYHLRRLLTGLLLQGSLLGTSNAAESLVVYAESSAIDSRVMTVDGATTVQGFASDMVRTLLLQAGYNADIRVVPWPRVMSFLQSEANVLGLNMTRTPEREDLFHWIGEIRPVTFQLWGLRERIDELPNTLANARDARVSAYRNDVVEQYLLAQGFSNLVYVSENYDSFAMLQRRRIDFLPYSRIAMESFMARSEEVRNGLVPVIELDDISTAHYIVMSKTSDEELVAQIRAAYVALRASGAFEESIGNSQLP